MTRSLSLAWALAPLLMACTAERIDAGGVSVDAGADDDPLTVDEVALPNSLDDLQQHIITPRCSGQPGLCHAGQFQPNLSTAANSYAWLVNRPSTENGKRLRVAPGDAAGSFLVDKLRNRNVATMMPLGADPLTADEIAAIERWIDDGALRDPNEAPAPVLNNPPGIPEIAIYGDTGERLDSGGPFTVGSGTRIALRHSVEDFETDDPAIPFATFILKAQDGRDAVLRPGVAEDPHLGVTGYDPAAPTSAADEFNYRFELTIPAIIGLREDSTGAIEQVASAGLMLTPIVFYVDEFPGGILSFAVSTATMTVE